MYVVDETGCFRFQISMPGKEEFGVKSSGLGVKAHVLADSATDIIINFGAFYASQEGQDREQPVLCLELYVDGVLRNIVKARTGRGLADKQFAEAKIDRGVVLARNGKRIMKRFRFVDLDLDDSILNCRLVEEAGTIEVKVLDVSCPPDNEDMDECLFPSMQDGRGAVSLLGGELNNTLGVRFDDGDVSIADNKYASLQQSTSSMVARQARLLGKTIAQASFIYGSADLMNTFGVIPKDHKHYYEEIATGQRSKRQGYVETDPKFIQKALFESDYSLGTRMKEIVQSDISPPSPKLSATATSPPEDQEQPSAILPENQINDQKSRDTEMQSVDTTPLTPQKTPGPLAKLRSSSFQEPMKTPNIKKEDGISRLTPEATPASANCPIYISSDEDEDITFLQQRKLMKLDDSPLGSRHKFEEDMKEKFVERD